MKKILLIIALVAIVVVSFPKNVKSQVVDIKKWTGTYPDMEGTYPLTFIAFKGWLIPIPHVFVRTWPSHYYVEAGALPVTDAAEIGGATKTGLLRIAAKMLERLQMKERHDETILIMENTGLQKQIEEKMFNSRADQIQDLYQTAQDFIKLYQKLNRFGQLENSSAVKNILEKEADDLLLDFLMINLLHTDHGEKLDAFTGINTSLYKLMGEVDYTWCKMYYFNNTEEDIISYSFLTN